MTFEVHFIIFPTIHYGPKLDKKLASKLALENLHKEPCGQKNPNRKFGKKKRQNVIFKPPCLLVRQRLILRVLKLYKYYLLSHKLESFERRFNGAWERRLKGSLERRFKGSSLFLFFFFFSILFIFCLVLCVYYLCLC